MLLELELPWDEKTLESKADEFEAAFRKKESMLVAFSGGVDSALVAFFAHRALGDRALAVTADTESTSKGELEGACKVAREIGVRHKIVRYSELANPSYVKNDAQRCYHCRHDLAENLLPLARDLGFQTLADGVLWTDLGEDRPGIRALDERGFWHPWVEFHLSKSRIRTLAHRMGLSVHAKPSMACLSSRIPHGTPVTSEKLRLVEEAEEFVRGFGFRQVRVRHEGETARIEVFPEEVPRLTDPSMLHQIREGLVARGYKQVSVNPKGYRSEP